MIARHAVIAAALARLRSGNTPVGFTGAPNPAPKRYHVLELPSGPVHDDGDLADPERHLLIRFRVRTVAEANDREAAALAALEAADAARVLLRSAPLTGPGWRTAPITTESSGGADNEGTLANVVDDFTLLAVPS